MKQWNILGPPFKDPLVFLSKLRKKIGFPEFQSNAQPQRGEYEYDPFSSSILFRK